MMRAGICLELRQHIIVASVLMVASPGHAQPIIVCYMLILDLSSSSSINTGTLELHLLVIIIVSIMISSVKLIKARIIITLDYYVSFKHLNHTSCCRSSAGDAADTQQLQHQPLPVRNV